MASPNSNLAPAKGRKRVIPRAAVTPDRTDAAPTALDSAAASPAVGPSTAAGAPASPLVPRPSSLVPSAPAQSPALIKFRPYQLPVFQDRTTGILVLHWSRQIGKSFTLASWAVDRLLSRPGRLVTVLSNSRDNGAEFLQKCTEVCRMLGLAEEQVQANGAAGEGYASVDQSADLSYEAMRMECRVSLRDDSGILRTGRIKVLAANPRTARGFSGDLILDEFAFHEDSVAIWEAAEPILSSNPDFLCRIASTGNGRANMFYRMAAGPGPYDGTPFASIEGFKVSRVARSQAHKQGVKVYDPNTREPITPEQAESKAMDKRAYRQNYECEFADENSALLPHALISSCERSVITIDSQVWTPSAIARMHRAHGDLYVGADFGRQRDRSSVPVAEQVGRTLRIIAWLRMEGMRLPQQREQIELVCRMPRFRGFAGDATGIGLGVCEELEEEFGSMIEGVNFGSTEPVTDRIAREGRKRLTARVTEIMATDLVAAFEDSTIEIPADQDLRDSLRKPEKIVSPGGRVSIAAERDGSDHADDFWGLALLVRASAINTAPGQIIPSTDSRRMQVVDTRRTRAVIA